MNISLEQPVLPKFTVDTHCDSILNVTKGSRLRHSNGHLDLLRMNGVVRLQFFALFIEERFKPNYSLERTLELLDLFLLELEQNKDLITLVTTKQELEVLYGTQNTQSGALLALEGGEGIKDIYILRLLFRLGVRCIGLTWNQRNHIADGVFSGDRPGGLTHFGKKLIYEMNKLGILIDAAHLAPASFWDVLNHCQSPIIVSHGNCRTICDHPRNYTDLQLKTLASQGGIACITFAPQFLKRSGEISIEDVIDHITYAADLIGANHVGIGSDFDGVGQLPRGIEHVGDYKRLYSRLAKRGFSKEEVDGICGENVRKLLYQILP